MFRFCLLVLLAAYTSFNLWHGILCRLLTLIVRLFFVSKFLAHFSDMTFPGI